VRERKRGFKPPPLHIPEQLYNEAVEGRPSGNHHTQCTVCELACLLQILHDPLALGFLAASCSKHSGAGACGTGRTPTWNAALFPRPHTIHLMENGIVPRIDLVSPEKKQTENQ
jgi:hypothetical protein